MRSGSSDIGEFAFVPWFPRARHEQVRLYAAWSHCSTELRALNRHERLQDPQQHLHRSPGLAGRHDFPGTEQQPPQQLQTLHRLGVPHSLRKHRQIGKVSIDLFDFRYAELSPPRIYGAGKRYRPG